MKETTNKLAEEHIERMRHFHDAHPEPTKAALAYRRMLAHYYNLMIPTGATVLEIGCGSGELLALLKAGAKTGVDISAKQIERARKRVPEGSFHVQSGEALELEGSFDVIILSDTLNLVADVQALLVRLHRNCGPQTRLIVNFHNNLWRPILGLGRRLGVSAPEAMSSWLSSTDIKGLMRLADWELVRHEHRLPVPLQLFGLGPVLSRWLAPVMPWFCLTDLIVARPVRQPRRELSVSVVVPARNEAGNIEDAVLRTPNMGLWTELIFIEGNSKDDTWEAIERVKAKYPERRITTLRQTGKGKGNAVREAFAVAQGDLLMILDADLTMPPEELPKFYEVVASGRAEFANGSRLVYPMDEKAMQFLNLCANKTFGILFTWMLGQPVKDTLCGTKVLTRAHYQSIAANRSYFGDFDPFGDFDLLFGAGRLNLKITDVPIRYRERSYGSTNISRWSHGWLLLRMVLFAARKLKFV